MIPDLSPKLLHLALRGAAGDITSTTISKVFATKNLRLSNWGRLKLLKFVIYSPLEWQDYGANFLQCFPFFSTPSVLVSIGLNNAVSSDHYSELEFWAFCCRFVPYYNEVKHVKRSNSCIEESEKNWRTFRFQSSKCSRKILIDFLLVICYPIQKNPVYYRSLQIPYWNLFLLKIWSLTREQEANILRKKKLNF